VLENRLKEMELRYEEGKVPVPEFWGGFRVYPSSFEFWQGRPSRLHDRILYEKSDTDWNIKRLSP
jgi:pyridoxamine 5'-phosphate oxidase